MDSEEGDDEVVCRAVEVLPVHYFQSAPVQSVLAFIEQAQMLVLLAERTQVPEQARSHAEAFSSAVSFLHSPSLPLVNNARGADWIHNAGLATKYFVEALQLQQYAGLDSFKVNPQGQITKSCVYAIEAPSVAGKHIAQMRIGVDMVSSEDKVICSGELSLDTLRFLDQERDAVTMVPQKLTVPLAARLVEPSWYRSRWECMVPRASAAGSSLKDKSSGAG